MPDFALLTDFVDDTPFARAVPPANFVPGDLIDGVVVTPLSANVDGRGQLLELMTDRDGAIQPIVHVYQVFAAPKSVRAWVYHKRQSDRLAYTNGRFRLVLFDLRPDSPTFHRLNVFEVGAAFACRVTIPPRVAHGLQNNGDETATFINMPTRAYDPSNPDKSRLPKNHPGIPYRFD